METKSTVIFIGEKVNKIRWKPSDLQESNIFLSGSWDASTNHLKLWKYDSGDDSISNLHKLAVPADVNEIRVSFFSINQSLNCNNFFHIVYW